jgi:hypothetical protein
VSRRPTSPGGALDALVRVRSADLARWRDLAAARRAPLVDYINAAVNAYEADRDADAELGRDVRALVAQPRRRGPHDTQPIDFDPAQAAAERHAALEKGKP